MSVLLLSRLWCTLQVSGVTQISVLFLTHLLRHTYGVLERSLVSLKGHWFPWHFVLSWTRSLCPWHACGVPDTALVFLTLLQYVWHVCGVSKCLWYMWHIFDMSDTSVVSLTHLCYLWHIYDISHTSVVLWTHLCHLWPPKVVLTFYYVPETAVVSLTNMYCPLYAFCVLDITVASVIYWGLQ